MTEFRYVQVFSDTCDKMLVMIGMDADYVTNTGAWYTAETHNMQVDEIGVNERIYSTMQMLVSDTKRLHVFYRLHSTDDDRLLATTEAMYLHVGKESGKVCDAESGMVEKARRIADAHADLPRPDAVGRYVGQRRQD